MKLEIPFEKEDIYIDLRSFLLKYLPDKQLREIAHSCQYYIENQKIIITITIEEDKEYILKNFPELLI